MKGWLADLLRTAWAFLYWNTRKTWFRLRGARGICPCQNPSDSGKAYATGCEAIIGWARPARFRRVCPLLQRGADGRWCCSADAAKVRPFWGLAAKTAASLIVAGYAIGVLAAFVGLRAAGYELSLAQVAWPPSLRAELPKAQSARFLRQVREHYAAGRVSEAMLALRSAWIEDPNNYAAGMLLAQFAQGVEVHSAAQIYARLRSSHPDRRAETTRAWFYALLTHGDFGGVAELASEELATAGNGEEQAWLHALIFACRRTHDAAPLERAAAITALSESARDILKIESAVLRGTLIDPLLQARLVSPLSPEATSYAYFYRVDRLATASHPQEALQVMRAAGPKLSGRDQAALLLELMAIAGDDASRVVEIKMFLAARSRLNDAEWELLCAHLIRWPQAEAMRAVAAVWKRDAVAADASQVPWALAVFSAAAINRDDVAQREVKEWLKQLGNDQLAAALDGFGKGLIGKPVASKIVRLIPTIPPMPLEVVYSLLSIM